MRAYTDWMIDQELSKITDAEWAEHDRRADEIVYDPAYVADWQAYLHWAATEAAIEAESQDLEDARQDEMFWRTGC